MAIDSNYEFSASDEFDYNSDESANDLDNTIAEFDLNINSTEGKNSKHNNKRNFLAKKKLEQLQEERRLKKFDEDYDDWD
ncbi:MAG: hypothetical protein ACI9LM_003070 [Alteromonadaceae bacterium]|jgi:hypothetical protein